jgi:hypothetical protein
VVFEVTLQEPAKQHLSSASKQKTGMTMPSNQGQ